MALSDYARVDMEEIDWRSLPEVEIGPIPPTGYSYYDGILDANNENFFITICDTLYPEGEDKHYIYESVYAVYKMDDNLAPLCNWKDVLKAREYVLTLEPVGYILEGNLDRTGKA